MSPSVRPLRDDELGAYLGVVNTAMLSPPAGSERVEDRRSWWEIERCLGAHDPTGRLCGVARSFGVELTVPGGAVPAAAVSAVGVLPTHRRQGHLGRLMRAQLADVRDRGETVAILIAAEYPIYGRYGYGPAIHACTARLDATAEWRDEPTGSVEMVGDDDWAEAAAAVYERARQATPGHIIDRSKRYWQWQAGLVGVDDERTERRDAPKVVWRDREGEAQGVALYRVKDDWVRNRPMAQLTALPVVAATPEAERELFRFLASVDWVTTVRAGLRPVDDPLPLWLVDGRAAMLEDHSDHVWLRPLDVPGALTARTYATEGSLVVELVDDLGHASGRFALDAGPSGATCSPTTRSPELTAPASALGAAYLGGTPWTRLLAAGWIDEHVPGATERARALFSAPRAPWCAMSF